MLMAQSQTYLFMFSELLTKEIKYRKLLGDNRIGTNSNPLMFANCDGHVPYCIADYKKQTATYHSILPRYSVPGLEIIRPLSLKGHPGDRVQILIVLPMTASIGKCYSV